MPSRQVPAPWVAVVFILGTAHVCGCLVDREGFGTQEIQDASVEDSSDGDSFVVEASSIGGSAGSGGANSAGQGAQGGAAGWAHDSGTADSAPDSGNGGAGGHTGTGGSFGGSAGSGGAATCEGSFECVRSLSGWSSVGYVLDRDQGASCAPGFTSLKQLHDAALTTGNPTCACSCGAPLSDPCASLKATLSVSASCAGPAASTNYCVFWGANSTIQSYRNDSTASGYCAVTATKVNAPPVKWSKTYDMCVPSTTSPSNDCPTGHVCVPKVPAGARHCVAKEGTNLCPPSFSHQKLFYTNVTDGTTCGSGTCSCTMKPNQTCPVKLSLRQNSCIGTVVASALLSDNLCHESTSPTIAKMHYVTVEKAPGFPGTLKFECAATGTPQPLGTVTVDYSSTYTVCCTEPP